MKRYSTMQTRLWRERQHWLTILIQPNLFEYTVMHAKLWSPNCLWGSVPNVSLNCVLNDLPHFLNLGELWKDFDSFLEYVALTDKRLSIASIKFLIKIIVANSIPPTLGRRSFEGLVGASKAKSRRSEAGRSFLILIWLKF